MPSEPRSAHKKDLLSTKGTSYGQVIEYIRDRLYLASYTHAPTSTTPFPYPLSQSQTSAGASESQDQDETAQEKASVLPPIYFSIDKYLRYNSFYADFGPLHIGHAYRFSILLHDVLSASEKENRPIVFWSKPDSRSRANAACVLACYMILVQNWPPHLVLAPIAQMDPPLMPFRDAGYSQADYILNVQDIVYGVWRAKEEGLCQVKQFNLAEYEMYERVDMGDFNWISPNFVAFASPQHQPIAIIPATSPEFAALPTTAAAVLDSSLPQPFRNVLAHFKERKVGLVVRLNSELYSPSHFTALGIKHLDMIFDDGTCPPLALVKKFIKMAHDMITVKHRNIAVHCKAGLGRTGCLIGAYLIYRHGFTANEVIAYMRFMRPGMVVGPQQHWLHLNQGTFREWWYEDSLRDKLALLSRSTPPRMSHRQALASNGQTSTPTNGSTKRRALGELDDNLKDHSATAEENLPAPTPGQPRKTSKLYGGYSLYTDNENEPIVEPDTEIVSIQRHTRANSESEEEFQVRMLARRSSRSPGTSNQKQRAVSCVTTTTTTTEWNIPGGAEAVAKSPAAKTPLTNRSGNGSNSLSVGKRSSPLRKATSDNGRTPSGVRKVSGRVSSPRKPIFRFRY